MAKFFGKIGFTTTEETAPGVFRAVTTERDYRGDVLRNTRKWENGEYLNDDLNVNNQISIVADAYANENFFAMRYISWMGAYWKITNVEVQRPRLILTIGGVYNKPASLVARTFRGDSRKRERLLPTSRNDSHALPLHRIRARQE